MDQEKYKSKVMGFVLFTAIGLCVMILPILLWGSGPDNIGLAVLFFFGLMIAVLGIYCIFLEKKKTKIVRDLIYRNEFIYARFEDIKETYYPGDRRTRGYYTYQAVFSYTDSYNKRIEFLSHSVRDVNEIIYRPGDSAKIFVDLSTPQFYMISDQEIRRDPLPDNTQQNVYNPYNYTRYK